MLFFMIDLASVLPVIKRGLMNNKDSRGKMCEHSFSFEITIQETIIPRAEVVKEGKELCMCRTRREVAW